MAWGRTGLYPNPGDDGVQKPWLKQKLSPQPSWVRSQHKWQPKIQSMSGQKTPLKVRPAPLDFQLDRQARYAGTVAAYWKWKGYGFIRPDEDSLVPDSWLFVHWSNIQSDDRYPSLVKGMRVEFGMMKWKEIRRNFTTLRAKYVTLEGGSMIAVQDDIDSAKKTFVGGQAARYTGTVKFYSPKGGYGYVRTDEVFGLDPSVPTELRVEEQEVNAGGRKPNQWLDGLRVEFGIWITQQGKYQVYNMTLPDGVPITEEHLEHREVIASSSHIGTITYWNWNRHFGLIKIAKPFKLPEKVQAKLNQMKQASQQKGKAATAETLLYFRKADLAKGCNPREGLNVSFKVYIDDKGAGACEVDG